jgi:hypothetical protein
VKRHQDLLTAAIARDGEAHSALMRGDAGAARAAFTDAADLYRQSWEAAPPTSYGRLVGMLKATVLAGESGEAAADYTRRALGQQDSASPTASYAQALAAVIAGDDQAGAAWAEHMRAGSEAFGRTADAIAALADGDRARYRRAVEAIVRDFEARSEHLTGVPIADTALMLQVLAERRGIAAEIQSAVLPGER